MNKLTMDSAAELFELHARGQLASMFTTACIEPDSDEWRLLRGEEEITLAKLGSTAFKLGFELAVALNDRVAAEVVE